MQRTEGRTHTRARARTADLSAAPRRTDHNLPISPTISLNLRCAKADQLGDTSTLADPSIVDKLVAKVNALYGGK